MAASYILGEERNKMSWFEYELDKRRNQFDHGVDFRHRYGAGAKVIGGAEVVNSIVGDANKMYGVKDKFIEKLKSILEYMKGEEKNAASFNTSVSLHYFTSHDLSYVINNSNLNDAYLVKSLYDDLIDYYGIENPKKIDVVELYNSSARNDKEISELEDKNRDYLICLEDLYKEIIYNVGRS